MSGRYTDSEKTLRVIESGAALWSRSSRRSAPACRRARSFPDAYYTLRRIDWYRDVKGLLPPPFEEFGDLRVRFDIGPAQIILVVVNDAGQLKVRGASWGFTQHWAGEKPKFRPITAKCETVATEGMIP